MAKADTGRDTATSIERLARLMRAAEHASDLNPAQWEALRYLARCNRFSNSPAALTQYLSATKGTVSQTVIALARKGLVVKGPRDGEARSLALVLSEQGQARLAGDPWVELAIAIDGLGPKTHRRLTAGVAKLLAGALKQRAMASFGVCTSCRYFRERGAEADPAGPHQCLHYEAPLTKAESKLICVSHDPA